MVDFDPRSVELARDPYPTLERLRDEAPLLHLQLAGRNIHVLSRHADVARVLGEPTTLMNSPGTGVPAVYGDGAAATLWRNAISMMDPPQHTRMRRVILKPFTRRRVQDIKPTVTAIVAEVFDGLGSDRPEIVRDLALQVPMRVICALLGIRETDWAQLEAWTSDFLRIFVPDITSPEEVRRVQAASRSFIDFFGALIDDRRASPRDDLTSGFTAMMDGADGLTRDELIGALRGLLTAGFETTAATIAGGVLGFAQQPDQMRLIREQPRLIPGAVEELLRWESPVQMIVRHLGEAMPIQGETLPAGDVVWLLLGAANHDPRRFSDPARIDVRRTGVEHFSFGGGRHFCLGAHLARLELQAVLAELGKRWQCIELRAPSVPRRNNFMFRSIEKLPVSVVPAACG